MALWKPCKRAKSLQLCPSLCDSVNCSLPGLCPWDSSGKHTGVGEDPPGDLPNPGVRPASLTSPALAGRFFATSTTWEALIRGT